MLCTENAMYMTSKIAKGSTSAIFAHGYHSPNLKVESCDAHLRWVMTISSSIIQESSYCLWEKQSPQAIERRCTGWHKAYHLQK